MSTDCFRRLLYAVMALMVLAVPGCGKNTANQPMDKAMRIVDTFLDAWTRGEPPDNFADPDRPIQGIDPDWKAGYRLLSFLTAEAKQSEEAPDHIRCRVALSLRDLKGRKADKDVVYDVHVADKSVIRRVSP